MLSYFEHLKTTKEFIDEIEKLRFLHNEELSLTNALAGGDDRKKTDVYWGAVDDLCKRFKLTPIYSWSITIHHIVVYDLWEVFNFFDEPDASMCGVTSFDELRHLSAMEKEDDPIMFKTAYPVVIGVHPNSSMQDIIDFVRKTYKSKIAPLLDEYKDNFVEIGKVKKKRRSERDDFIFEHKHLKYEEIDRLQNEKFGKGILGYDYIGKIIRKEKKRRGIED